MGLAVVLAALHFYPSSSREYSHDPEKGFHPNVRNGKEPQRDQPASRQERYGQGNPGPEHDSSSSAGNPTKRRQGRRRPIFRRVSTADTTATIVPLTSRIKAFFFPKDDPETLEQYVPNYRWTPIISGIVIPFSILLEIPGLTERWYIRTHDGQTVETKRNSAILDTGLAFSLAFGLFANICLIMRFLEKRVQLMTLLSIIFLTLHGWCLTYSTHGFYAHNSLDLINIVTVTIFGVGHRFDDGFTYGESFWMTVCSTAASTITNISLIYDYIKTPDFSKSGELQSQENRYAYSLSIDNDSSR